MKIEVRCPKCNKKLMEIVGQAEIKCPRCKTMVEVDTTKHILRATKKVNKIAY